MRNLGAIQQDEVLEELVEVLKAPNGVTLFVGAGLSIPCGFPGWTNFLMKQAETVGLRARIRSVLDEGEYDAAAQELAIAFGGHAFNDSIRHMFGANKTFRVPERSTVS